MWAAARNPVGGKGTFVSRLARAWKPLNPLSADEVFLLGWLRLGHEIGFTRNPTLTMINDWQLAFMTFSRAALGKLELGPIRCDLLLLLMIFRLY